MIYTTKLLLSKLVSLVFLCVCVCVSPLCVASACVVFTADEGVRGGKIIHLKKMVDEALDGCQCVKKVYVYKRTGADVPMNSERDVVLDDVSVLLLQVLLCVTGNAQN